LELEALAKTNQQMEMDKTEIIHRYFLLLLLAVAVAVVSNLQQGLEALVVAVVRLIAEHLLLEAVLQGKVLVAEQELKPLVVLTEQVGVAEVLLKLEQME
jgi:hypothetical protein